MYYQLEMKRGKMYIAETISKPTEINFNLCKCSMSNHSIRISPPRDNQSLQTLDSIETLQKWIEDYTNFDLKIVTQALQNQSLYFSVDGSFFPMKSQFISVHLVITSG